MSGIIVRPAAEADDRGLALLDATGWPAELQVAPPQPADQPFFSERRRARDVLVSEADGEVVGYIRLGRHLSLPSNDHVLHIEALVVAPQARGRGAGTALVQAALTEARRRGVLKVGLRALSNNPAAIRLYQRNGFTEEGRLRAELRRPDGSYADDVWMAQWLAPLPRLA